MPAAKLMPVGPSTATRPPVMYSQPWSPTPSTTAKAPELRTAKRSPASPREERAARGGAVEGHVAGDHVRLGREARVGRRADGDDAARRAPCRRSRSPLRPRSGSRRAPARRRSSGRRAAEDHLHACPRAARPAPWRRTISPESSAADGPVHVGDRALQVPHLLAAIDRAPRGGEDREVVERVVEHRHLRARPAARRVGGPLGLGISRAVRSTPRAFQCSIAGSASRSSGAADQVLVRCGRRAWP